ncbi:MAG: hypothetical protein COA70_13710 [Planctomycetota bacterium]|nr:MAG: hypothetical protein COA70_13710 [Planctomycetota bacterium]
MSVLAHLASAQGRRDEVPNVQLAQRLVAKADTKGIKELVGALHHEKKAMRHDALKALYEVAALEPVLVAPYAEDLLGLLGHKDSRMAWGSMTALGKIAPLQAKLLSKHFQVICEAMERGSVIACDHGVKVLAAIAARSGGSGHKIFDYLLEHLRTCRAKEVPQHGESTFVAVRAKNAAAFKAVLVARQKEFTPPQARRIKKLLQQTVELL